MFSPTPREVVLHMPQDNTVYDISEYFDEIIILMVKYHINKKDPDIMHHGTWQSDSVWKYIKSTPQATSPVASAFQRALLI